MKIAFFSECFRPTRNGVVVSVETFAHQLNALGHEVSIFAPRFATYRDDSDLVVHRFPSVPWPPVLDYPLTVPLSPRQFRKFDALAVDIVHAHNPWLIGRAAAYLARRRRKPLVLTYHTMFSQYMHYIPAAPVFARPIMLYLLRHYSSYCDLVIAPSDQVANSLTQPGGVSSRVVTLPTGVDVDWIARGDRDAGRRRFRIPPDAKVLVYVGRVAVEKNIDFLLTAVAAAIRQRPDTHLIIVGGGPHLCYALPLAESLGIADRAHFTGSVPREEVRNYLAAADVFVFASQTETQGIVVVEALAAGLPVVAVEATGVSSAVTDNVEGLLCPCDESAFALQLLRLLNDPDLRGTMSAAARARAYDFSARKSAQQLVRYYEEVIDRRRRGAC